MMGNTRAMLKFAKKALVPFCVILIVFAFLLGWFDRVNLAYRWATFWIWTIGVTGLFFFSFDRQNILSFVAFFKKHKFQCISIIALATISRFLLLETYPFYFIGDELRDGGLRGYEIYSGSWRAIFGYDWAQGLTSATLCAFAYSFFENSILTYRVPGALAAIITVISMLYILPRYLTPRAVWISCIAIIADWTHLHFSRTEPLIVISTLLILPLIHLLTINLAAIGLRSMLGMGLIIGTALGTHASVKPLVFTSIVALAFFAFFPPFSTGLVKRLLKNDPKIIVTHKFRVTCFFILWGAVLAGLGPRVYETSIETLFNPGRVRDGGNFSSLIRDVLTSYRALIDYDVTYHFGAASHQLLHSIILRVGVYIGLLFGLVLGSPFIRIICLACLMVPITNSALTTTILLDHRMFPLTLLSAIIAGYGFDLLISKLVAHVGSIFKGATTVASAQRSLGNILLGALLVSLSSGGFTYFYEEPSSARFPEDKLPFNFTFTYALYTVRDNPLFAGSSEICIIAKSEVAEEIKLAHNQEAIAFILPQIKVHQISDSTIKNQQELFIKPGACPQTFNREHISHLIYCKSPKAYVCPQNKETISIGIVAP